MPRAGITKQILIDAATAIADRHGLEGVTLAAVAGKFRVKPPSLYKHVDGLDEILAALAARGLHEANERLQRATIGKAGEAALMALAHAYWQFARDRPGLYAASQRSPRAGDREVAMAGEAMMGTIVAVIGSFGLTSDDARHATRGLRAIIHGFVSLDAAGSFRMRLDLAESFDRLLTLFAHDLTARAV